MDSSNNTFADILQTYINQTGFAPGTIAKLSGVPKGTIINWREGRVVKPRSWQQVVRVASAMRLDEVATTRLLRACGFRSIASLLQNITDADDRVLLQSWDIPRRTYPSLPHHTLPDLQAAAATVATAHQHFAQIPTDAIPQPALLPPGSRMPLRPNPLFVDRQRELRMIAHLLRGDEGAPHSIGATVAITGMGVVGKTQLAAEFAHRYGQFFAGGVFWLSCAGDQALPAEIAACGGAAYLRLHPEFNALPLTDQIQLVLAAWSSGLPHLLILDNCEDEALIELGRPSSGSCSILITSRRARWNPILDVQTLSLHPLPRTHGIQLLRNYLTHLHATNNATFDAIAAQLGDLPLAIHLAGTYLHLYQHAIDPPTYLRQLQQLADGEQASLLSHPSMYGRQISPTAHEQHVAHTFGISINQLDPDDDIDRRAMALLDHAAIFAPGEAIPRDLLLRTTMADVHAVPMLDMIGEDAMLRLINLGLLQVDTDGKLRLHILLGSFVRAQSSHADARANVEIAMLLTTERYNALGDIAPMLALQSHLRHILEQALPRADERAAALCNVLGQHLWMMASYGEAQFFVERGIMIREQLPQRNPDTLAGSYNLLALIHQLQGQFAHAQALFERARAMWSQHFAPDHSYLAAVDNNLGYVLMLQGDYRAAHGYFRRALAFERRSRGLRQLTTARVIHNLGYLALRQGRLRAARRYLLLALAIREQILSPDHVSTAATLNFLGETAYALHAYEQAMDYHQRALAMRRRLYVDHHHDIAESLYNIGRVLHGMDDLIGARSFLDRALTMNNAMLGPYNRETAFTLHALGCLLQDLGDHREAIGTFEQAIQAWEGGTGRFHPDTASTLYQLGTLYLRQGRHREAHAALTEARDIQSRLLGKHHPDTRLSCAALADLQRNEDQIATV